MEKYAIMSSHPYETGPLDPKMKELLSVAKDAAITHRYIPGLRIHMENAIGYGATREEVMETLEISSIIGMQTHWYFASELLSTAGEN
jgi:alkylhydroperoxidase/carboxymuconolactone decarboxylase family protein YurZ